MDVLRGGHALKSLRLKQKMKQQELADLCHIRRQKISEIETGVTQNLNLEDLYRIGKMLGLDLNHIGALYEVTTGED